MMFDPFDELEMMEDYWGDPSTLEDTSFIVDSPPRASPPSSSSSSSISPSKPTEKHDKPPKTSYASAKELYFNDPVFELEDCAPYFNFSAPQPLSPAIKNEPAATLPGALASAAAPSGLGLSYFGPPLKTSPPSGPLPSPPQAHSVDYFTPLSDYTPQTKKRKLSPGGQDTAFSGPPAHNTLLSDRPEAPDPNHLLHKHYQKAEGKRQRRIVKSTVSRNRIQKKSQIDELEKKVIELTQENVNLRENLENMARDNAKLREEVYLLQSAVHKSGMNAVMTRGTSFLSSLGKQKQVHASTGLVLLVVLFSFGLFFNNLNMAQQQKSVIVSNRIETALPQAKCNRKETKQWSTSAVTGLNSFEKRKQEIELEVEEAPKQPLLPPAPQAPSLPPDSLLVAPQLTESSPQRAHLSKVPHISDWKQNTTYLLVDSLSQLLPPARHAQIPAGEDELPVFSFVVPPDKATNFTGLGGLDEGAFLEICCHVIAFNRIPALLAKT
eukprot:TRINITY_DN10566_c0_g1_i2.p1 TRINITY_DN10566_c0_g1~~TRINITY_DN10566_c0_g1_i2.p1  ORF type:complete len:495 (+),score=111.23 TRINITY_DN10566_c0_g1_i2:86-1570(+)